MGVFVLFLGLFGEFVSVLGCSFRLLRVFRVSIGYRGVFVDRVVTDGPS